MRRLLTYLLIIVIAKVGNSQNLSLIKSLRDSAKLVKNDSLRALLYSDLNYQWAEYDFDSAWYYATELRGIAKQLSEPVLVARGMRAQGLAYDYQNQFDSAIYYYQEAADYSRLNGDELGQANAIFNLGVVHSFKGELEKALEKYSLASEVYESLNNRRMLGILHNNMGIIYRKTKKYELAKISYQKSLHIKMERKDENSILNTLTNISAVCRFLGQYDSAVHYSNKALIFAKQLQNETSYLHELINLAIAYEMLDNGNAALTYYEEAEELLDPKSPYETKAQVLLALSKYYLEQNQLNNSLRFLNRMELILDDEVKPDIAYDFYSIASSVYKERGDAKKALSYLTKAGIQKEKLWDNEVLTKTTELEQLYEKEKREAVIAQLNAETQLQSLAISKKDQQRNGLIIFVVLLSIVTSLAIMMFRQKRKSLNEKEMLIQEIHHRVKNNLQVISSLLKLQAGNLSDDAAKKAVKEGENRVKAMALIHQRLYGTTDLRGVEAGDYFDNLLSELFHSFGVNNELVSYQVDASNIKLDIDTIIPLGLIVNELITNALKYAFAENQKGKIEISFVEKDEQLIVVVSDDGQGIKEAGLDSGDSFGWKMIKSLSRKLEADIEIEAENGTTVKLSISQYKLVA